MSELQGNPLFSHLHEITPPNTNLPQNVPTSSQTVSEIICYTNIFNININFDDNKTDTNIN